MSSISSSIEINACSEVKKDNIRNEFYYPYQKMTAKQQREIFGFALFGRKSIQWNSSGGIDTRVRVDFGRDYHIESYSWNEIAEYVKNQEKV